MKRTILILIIIASTISVYAQEYLTKDLAKDILKGSEIVEVRQILLTDDIKETLSASLNREDILEDQITLYTGKTRGETDAFCLAVNEEGKHGTIVFAVVIKPDGKVKEVRVLESKEIRGKKISQKRFLNQFTGKNTSSLLKVGKDIQGISGATISSSAAAKAVKKAVHILQVLALTQ